MANIFRYQSVDYLYEMGYCSASLVQHFKAGGINDIQDIADTLSTMDPNSFVKTYSIKNSEYKQILRVITNWKITPTPYLSKTKESTLTVSERSKSAYNTIIEEYLQSQNFDNVLINSIASVRLTNALRHEEILTVKDLLLHISEYGIDSLKNLRNIGRKSQKELDEIITNIIQFIPQSEDDRPVEIDDNKDSSLERHKLTIIPNSSSFVGIPKFSIHNLAISNSTSLYLQSQDIHWTNELYEYCKTHSLADLYNQKLKSISIDEIVELASILTDRQTQSKLVSKLKGEINLKQLLGEFAFYFDESFIEISKEDSVVINMVLQKYYTSKLDAISTRTNSIIKKYNLTHRDLYVLHLLPKTYVHDVSCPKQCGINSWSEIIKLSKDINDKLRELIGINTDELQMSLISICFPTIGHNQKIAKIIHNHYYEYGYLPMFYILAKHICTSGDRFESIYKYTYGIFCEQLNMFDIATLLDLSRERVRQILSNKIGFNVAEITDVDKYAPYDLLSKYYISKNDELYSRVVDREGLETLSFYAFGYLVNLIMPVKHYQVKYNHYFFTQRLLDCFDIKSALTDIENTLSKKVAKDTEIPITIFVDSYWINAPSFEPIEVIKMLCEIISDNFEVKIDDNYRITIFQNTIDVSSELHDIINANGDSMNIDDIFVAFKEKYPEHKYSEASQLRPYLARDERICPIGKTSCYTLLKWDTFTGTLKDLIYNTLLDSEVPLTAEDICEIIHETYDTTPKSIRSTVVSDKSGKFIFFKKGYIGVNTKEYSSVYESLKFADRRHRQSFEDSLNEYEEYLRTHHHMPLSTGTEDEQFLYRWYNNVVNRCMTITLEREVAFNAMVTRNADYMVNGTEYSFYRRCDEYKAFLDENMELPTMETDTVLYRWFHNNIKTYMEFDDRRKGYFEDLISYIESYGFVVR